MGNSEPNMYASRDMKTFYRVLGPDLGDITGTLQWFLDGERDSTHNGVPGHIAKYLNNGRDGDEPPRRFEDIVCENQEALLSTDAALALAIALKKDGQCAPRLEHNIILGQYLGLSAFDNPKDAWGYAYPQGYDHCFFAEAVRFLVFQSCHYGFLNVERNGYAAIVGAEYQIMAPRKFADLHQINLGGT